MARYVDGFLLPIPGGRLAEYRKLASRAGKVWMKHGALEFDMRRMAYGGFRAIVDL